MVHTFIFLEQLNDQSHGWQRQFGNTTRRNSSLQRKSGPVLRTALLHLDELAKIRQGRLHFRIGRTERRPFDGALEELAGKSCVNGQARVAAKSCVLLAAVKIGRGLACRAAASRLRGGDDAAGCVAGDARHGEILEKRLDAPEARLYLVNLALTGMVSKKEDVATTMAFIACSMV